MDETKLSQLLDRVNEIHDYLTKANELNQIFASSIEALEKQFATISMGYVEQAVMIEGLINLISDEDERKVFHEFVTVRRAAVLKAIEEGSDALSGVTSDFDSTVG